MEQKTTFYHRRRVARKSQLNAVQYLPIENLRVAVLGDGTFQGDFASHVGCSCVMRSVY